MVDCQDPLSMGFSRQENWSGLPCPSPWDLPDTTVDLCLTSLTLAGSSSPLGFPDSSVGQESACNVGDLGSIPGLGRSPGEGNGYLLQYSCLENSMDERAWQATVHGVIKSQTQLNN